MPLETLENKNLVSQRNFLDDNLRLEALTHKSFHYENPSNGPHNERLEFLGDSIVSFVVANYLFGRFPHFKEGQLTLLRANLVCKKKLAQFALQLGLDSEIRLGVGALRDGGRASEKVLEDAFEAYIGAVFLDSGSSLYAVQEFMEPLLTPAVDKLTHHRHIHNSSILGSSDYILHSDLQDPINKLQTWSQRRGLGIPVYVPFCVRSYATETSTSSDKLRLSFALPHQTLYKNEEVYQVNISSTSGDMGILTNHVPSIEQLKPGLIEIYENPSSSKKIFSSGGFAVINSDSTLEINAPEAHPLEDFSIETVRSNLAEAQRVVNSGATDEEKNLAKIEIEVYEALQTTATMEKKIKTNDNNNNTDDVVVETKFRGRIGYANQKPPIFCSRTCRIVTIKQKGMEYVKQLGIQNVTDLCTLVKWNEENNIKFMRISSDIFPFASHEEYGYSLDYAAKELRIVGDFAKKNGHRLTTHPGQYNQLGSPNSAVVRKTYNDLSYHAEMMDLMGLPKDSIMVIHMGGVYNSKETTLKRFEDNYLKVLSPSIRDRLVLENDEICYNVQDLLPICKKLKIPLVLDCLNSGTLSDQDLLDLIPEINKTWTDKGIKPKQHYSEGRPGASNIMEKRAHSDRVKYKLYSVNPKLILPPAELETLQTRGRKSNNPNNRRNKMKEYIVDDYDKQSKVKKKRIMTKKIKNNKISTKNKKDDDKVNYEEEDDRLNNDDDEIDDEQSKFNKKRVVTKENNNKRNNDKVNDEIIEDEPNTKKKRL
ncbi:23956_t:CDS:10, partial [Entrophospora sp. SA101]